MNSPFFTSFLLRFRRNRGAMLGLTILLVVILMAVIGPMLIVNDPWAMLGQPFAEPFTIDGLPLGSDTMGRDLMAGLVHGARVSLVIALISTTVALLIGVTLGALAGYHGGWVDSTIMRFTDLFHAVPGFALAVVMVAIFQPSIYSIITAIAAVTWAPVARLVRSEFLSLRQREFVQAALLAGQSDMHIIFTQILPNAVSSIVVMGSLMVASAILLESALSFLGLGDPNMMSWGYMVGSARTALRQAWWIAVFPGLAIAITVLALNLVGEGLSDGLNTRLTGKK
ncbi:MAG: ABC transporter permease [Burkholderiaceae bacterium]|nr:ABC transporter permease [Burkholderiaceae bacterium]